MNETITAWRKARAKIYRAVARNLDARADLLWWLADNRRRGKMDEVVRSDPDFAAKLQARVDAFDADLRAREARFVAAMESQNAELRRMNGAVP